MMLELNVREKSKVCAQLEELECEERQALNEDFRQPCSDSSVGLVTLNACDSLSYCSCFVSWVKAWSLLQ